MATTERAETIDTGPERPGFLRTPSSRRKPPAKQTSFSERLAASRPFVAETD